MPAGCHHWQYSPGSEALPPPISRDGAVGRWGILPPSSFETWEKTSLPDPSVSERSMGEAISEEMSPD